MNNDSDTSADLQMNILDNLGDKIETKEEKKNDNDQRKPESSDTDYYLNLLANQSKLNDNSDNKTNESSSIDEILESDSERESIKSSSSSSSSSRRSKSSSSSRKSFKKVDLSPRKTESPRKNVFIPQVPPTFPDVKKELSPQEIRMKKIELLRRLSELKSKGFELSKGYDFDSSIEEMEYEYELLKSFANKRNGVKLYKNILLNAVSAVEFLNDKYDPFEFQLTGWSEHMSVEVDSYDEVIEELYEKYKGTGKKMPAEIKLFFLIVASASAFHFSKSTFKNLPGVDKVLQSNPDLIAKMMNPQKESSKFMTEQEINLEKQRKAMIEKEKEMRNKPKNPDVGTFNKNNYAPVNEVKQEEKKVDIKAPMNVQDILNRLHQSENNNTSETQDETSSNNDRIVGTSSLNSSEKRKGRKKKNIMSIS
tara:strand:+ start:72 stop:1340 length:1269 start_codon:yes stop_codon:yes gene_type:complete